MKLQCGIDSSLTICEIPEPRVEQADIGKCFCIFRICFDGQLGDGQSIRQPLLCCADLECQLVGPSNPVIIAIIFRRRCELLLEIVDDFIVTFLR